MEILNTTGKVMAVFLPVEVVSAVCHWSDLSPGADPCFIASPEAVLLIIDYKTTQYKL